MKRGSSIALGLLMPLALLQGCGKDNSSHDGGIEPSDGGPTIVLPCGACTYTVSSKHLDGTLSTNAQPPTPYPYAISGMTIFLYGTNPTAPLATINLTNPSGGSGGTNVTQDVTTTVTSGVLRAKLRYQDNAGNQHTDDLNIR
jgi:hypothetical protein